MFAESEQSLPKLVGKDSNLAGAILERIKWRGQESLEASRSQDQQAGEGRGPAPPR